MKPNLSPSKLSLSCFPFLFTPLSLQKKLQQLRVKEGKKHQRKKKSPLKVTNEKWRHLPWAKNSLETHPSLLDHSLPCPHHPVPCVQRMETGGKRKTTTTTFKLSHCCEPFSTKLLSIPQFLSIQETCTTFGGGDPLPSDCPLWTYTKWQSGGQL